MVVRLVVMVTVVLVLFSLLLAGVRSQDSEPIRETETGRQGGFVALRCGFSDVTWSKNVEGEQIDVKTLG